LHEKHYDEFKEKLMMKLKEFVVIGDPMNEKTTIGPLAAKK